MSTISMLLPPALPKEPIARISVKLYHAMIDAGVLTPNDPIELLEGWLVPKMPKNPPHVVATGLVCDLLETMLPPGWHIDCQGSITTTDSEPEPGVGVVRGKRRDYVKRHPGPKDMALIVEVAESSLERDRGIKKRIYARARVPVYLIVNLIDRCIEVYSEPTGPAKKPDYRQYQVYKPGDSVPLILDSQEIAKIDVNDILP